MSPLPTISQLLRGLMVPVLLVLLAMQGNLRPSLLDAALDACCVASEGAQLTFSSQAASLRDGDDSNRTATIAPEVSELDSEQQDREEPPSYAYDLTRVPPERQQIFTTAQHDTGPLDCWVAQLVSSGRPRGPPLS